MSSMPLRSVLLALVLALACGVCQAEFSFPVHRLLQWKQDGTPLGSQRVSVSRTACTADATGSDLSRYLVVATLAELSADKVQDLLVKRNAGGLLVVLPSSAGAMSAKQREQTGMLEHALLHQAVSVPVFFAYDDEANVADVLTALRQQGVADDSFQVSVTDHEARIAPGAAGSNLQGWLAGAGDEESDDEVPTIAVLAHIDSWAAAPSLAHGADSNGSGVAALFDIARRFHHLYAAQGARSAYNLMFVLVDAGHLDHAGVAQWLDRMGDRLAGSIEFVLCLDTLAASDNVYLHVSKPPKQESVRRLYDEFTTTADRLGLRASVVHKKVDVSASHVAWAHERIALAHQFAFTLSGRDAPVDVASAVAGGITDTRERVDAVHVARVAHFVAEVLARIAYDMTEDQEINVFPAFAGASDDSVALVTAWLDALARTPRVTAFLGVKDPLRVTMHQALSNFTDEVSRHTFPLTASQGVFYTTGQHEMSAARVKPLSFDLILMAGILVYLSGIFILLKGFAPALASLQSVFAPKY